MAMDRFGASDPASAPPRKLTAMDLEIADLTEAIGALAPGRLSAQQLPEARAELEAARREAGDGVTRVLGAVEALLAVEAASLAEFRRALEVQATVILEACAYEDLAGQRLAKVERLLADLQDRLSQLAVRTGVEDRAGIETAADLRRRQLHLNGPALGGPEVGQAAIDAMFD